MFAKVFKTLQVRTEANIHLTRTPLRAMQRTEPRARAVKVGQEHAKTWWPIYPQELIDIGNK